MNDLDMSLDMHVPVYVTTSCIGVGDGPAAPAVAGPINSSESASMVDRSVTELRTMATVRQFSLVPRPHPLAGRRARGGHETNGNYESYVTRHDRARHVTN